MNPDPWLIAEADRHARLRWTMPLDESLPLLRLVNSCPYRSRDLDCGCSGHRCNLRTDAPIVSHIECISCVKHYP